MSRHYRDEDMKLLTETLDSLGFFAHNYLISRKRYPDQLREWVGSMQKTMNLNGTAASVYVYLQ